MLRIPKIEDAAITHKRCVFADKEFIKSTRAIAARLGVSKKKPVEKIMLGGKYYIVVGDDAERVATKTEGEQLEKLASEFGISLADVLDFMNNTHKSPIYEYMKPRVEAKYWPPDGITVKVPIDATKQDYINQWEQIEVLKAVFHRKRKAIRHKPPENYPLVYAIFRAKSSGRSPKTIFDLYKAGKLPLYKGSNSQYAVADDLERYYRKYKPRPDT